MAFLIEKFWPALLIAAVLGACIGWITCGQKRSTGYAMCLWWRARCSLPG